MKTPRCFDLPMALFDSRYGDFVGNESVSHSGTNHDVVAVSLQSALWPPVPEAAGRPLSRCGDCQRPRFTCSHVSHFSFGRRTWLI